MSYSYVSVTGIVLSVLLAAAPVLLYLLFIWWLDRYDREPLWLVLATFAGGAATGGALAALGHWALGLSTGVVFGITGNEALDAVFIAPPVEELTKGLFLLLLFARREFDNTTDGLVYGAAAGLGFAATENLVYFLGAYLQGGAGSWNQVVFLRTLYSGVMHGAATGTLGAALGYAKYAQGGFRRVLVPFAGLLGAIVLHAGWNGSLLAVRIVESAVPMRVALVGVPLYGALLLALMQLSLVFESRTIARELREECALGIIPEAHLQILPFTLRRAGSGWLPPTVVKGRYVPLATTLAFRKFQRKRCGPGEAAVFDEEIAKLRREIRRVLNR